MKSHRRLLEKCFGAHRAEVYYTTIGTRLLPALTAGWQEVVMVSPYFVPGEVGMPPMRAAPRERHPAHGLHQLPGIYR